ncbi:hypothetical protein [Sphingobacterium pedocola]|uniref:Thioredoxin domain-containing protein n=1 Tax=Sphingobacterium pedocola TaxID=2082722 RepID=A0ABR9TAF8_9SPHI|nr:hypothetical protein [Sphingobacterium pedocola]MBE8722326.1 hypothetical protein [Sphingobacterium pedocola]
MNSVYNYSIVLMLWICAVGCQDSKKATAEKLVREWMGKEILFPDGLPCSYMGTDTICPEYADVPYKVLVYTDSVGCTSCKLNLNLWKHYMEEIDSLATDQVRFLFYFQPKSRKDLAHVLKRERLSHPVIMDDQGALKRINSFPEGMEYQCFLLDQDNKVVSIGNPTLNPKIWEVYKQVITDRKK